MNDEEFQYHESIPSQLHNASFRFIRVLEREKRPLDSKYVETNNYEGNNPIISAHLKNGGNYGIIPVGNEICVLDIDDIERCERLGILDLFLDNHRTFMIKTGGNGFHIMFSCKELVSKLPRAKRTPFFDPVDTNRHLGEIYPAGCKSYLVGPGSLHPNGKKYTIVQDEPIQEIPFEEINKHVLKKVKQTLISDEDSKQEQFEKRMPTARYTGLLSEEIGICIDDVGMPIKGVQRGSEIQGTHPVHGSSTGHNYSIDTRKNLWHCFRCNSGGDPITFIAVAEGLIRCEEAGTTTMTGELFNKVKEILRTKYHYGDLINDIEKRWKRIQTIRAEQNLPREYVDGEPEHHHEYGLKFDSQLSSDSLIERYVATVSKMTDAYIEFHYGSIYSLLSVATNRCAVIRMAHGDIYPNLWILELGISTISRKTTSINLAKQVARYHKPSNELPSSFTPEAMIEELADTPRVWWFKDEIGTLLSTMSQKRYMAEMRDFLNELFENSDYRRKLRSSKGNTKNEFIITAPYTSFLFATTPETFSEQTTPIDLTSGWLLRFLYFYPRYYKVSKPYMEADDAIREEFEHIRELIGERMTFFHLSGHELEFVLTGKAWEFFKSWQQDIETNLFGYGNHTLLAQYGRLFSYALKLAMIFRIADPDFAQEMAENTDMGIKRGQKTYLDTKYVVEACRQIDQYFAPISVEVAASVARQTEINVQEKILALLRRNNGRMRRVDIQRALHIKKKEFLEHAESLIDNEEIKEVVYQRPGKKADTWIHLTETQG